MGNSHEIEIGTKLSPDSMSTGAMLGLLEGIGHSRLPYTGEAFQTPDGRLRLFVGNGETEEPKCIGVFDLKPEKIINSGNISKLIGGQKNAGVERKTPDADYPILSISLDNSIKEAELNPDLKKAPFGFVFVDGNNDRILALVSNMEDSSIYYGIFSLDMNKTLRPDELTNIFNAMGEVYKDGVHP